MIEKYINEEELIKIRRDLHKILLVDWVSKNYGDDFRLRADIFHGNIQWTGGTWNTYFVGNK